MKTMRIILHEADFPNLLYVKNMFPFQLKNSCLTT